MYSINACKTSILFLMAGLLLAAAAPAHEATAVDRSLQYDSLDRTVIHYTLHEFQQIPVRIQGGEYLQLGLPGCAYVQNGDAGQPQLPRLTESVLIPDTARMEAHLLSEEDYEIEGVEIVPSKGSILRKVDPASVPYIFGPQYNENAFFPGPIVSLREPFIVHDVRGIVVEINPFQYNPVTKVLRVYHELTVEVSAVDNNGANPLDRSGVPHRPDKSFETIYANQFSNYAGNRTEPPSEDGDMLVISHGPFMSAMQPFVDWKNSIGINTTMVDVATIGNNATAIGNYIDNLYNTSNLAFVLLVGDHTEVASVPYSYTVSDPDYSTITPDWYPDLLIGRFSATTTAHVTTQVERTLAYEQELHDVSMGGWNAAALGVASNQGPGHYGEYDNAHVDLMMDELTDYGFTSITKSYDPSGTKTIIKNALNNGVRTVQYTGHGGPTGWGNGGGFSNSDVHALVNEGTLPFVVSVACNVGEFDYGECFCEAWQQATNNGAPTGSIAHYGSSVSQYWDEPMYGQGNHAYSNALGALERFWMENNWSIGAQWFGGSCIMMDICGTSGQDMFRTWIVFGDPSLRTYGSAGPQSLMSSSSAIPVYAPVSIDFSIDLEGCGGYNYVIVSGVTGTMPGTTLPGGLVVPINFDAWTYFCLAYMNTMPLLDNFMGVLDSAGTASATLNTSGLTPLDPRLIGDHLYFAAVAWPSGKSYEVATNFKVLTFTSGL
ncbi:MAG: C25 family cysteine peptidase [Planctomycetota bacterium]